MRLFRLISLAAQAEGLHLRRMGRGYAIQASLAAAAAVFCLFLLAMLHLAVFFAIAPSTGPVWAAVIVGAGDLVLLVIFGLAARRRPYDPVEVEALRVRHDAMSQVAEAGTRALMLAPLLKSQSAKKGLIGAALTAVVIGLISRR